MSQKLLMGGSMGCIGCIGSGMPAWLTNGKISKFQVNAVNQVGKATSEWSKHAIPDDEISKEQYLRKKEASTSKTKEKRRTRKVTKEKEDGRTKTKGHAK